MNRRQFLARAGVLGTLATLADLPAVVRARGLLDAVPLHSIPLAEADLVRDTVNGLVAFVVPGPDEYSVAQGVTTTEPGGIAIGVTDFLIESLDGYLPAPDLAVPNDDTIPLSTAVAALLNGLALTVDPVGGGSFVSPFARLPFEGKGEVFRQMEADTVPDEMAPEPFTQSSGNLRFVAGALLEFVAFGAYSEWHAFDPATRTLTGRPQGWTLTGYQPDGTVEGWDELRGYWQGRREVTG